ncbi:MAG: helix-turn-helix domain-containing protein [Candidatus Cloacimonetes bacterium]|nr:helix-turn-helix domain-containing protein [Candidatus Cloacimonadota bacterium]
MNKKQTERLEILEIAREIGISKTAELYKINRNTISRWIRNYDKFGLSGLKNASKKHLIRCYQMPKAIEDSIIKLKKENPNIKAKEIIQILNLNYSTSTITKKLRNSGIRRKLTKAKKRKTFSEFYFFVKQITDLYETIDGNREYYLFIMEDIRTGIQFYGVSFEKTYSAINLYFDYFIHKLKQYNISPEKVVFYTSNPVRLKLKELTDKYNLKISNEFRKTDLKTKFDLYNTFYKNLFKKKEIKTANDLLCKTFAYSINFNFKKVVEQKEKTIDLIQNISPILYDNYIFALENTAKSGSTWSSKEKDNIIEETLKYTLKIASTSEANYENSKALGFYDNALFNPQIQNNTDKTIQILMNKIEIYIRMGEKENFQKTIANIMKINEEHETAFEKQKLFLLLGNKFYYSYNFEEALKHYIIAYELAKKRQKTDEMSAGLMGIANSFLATGKNELGIKKYKEIYKLSIQTKNVTQQARALTSIGTIYTMLKQYEPALKFFKKAQKLSHSNKTEEARLLLGFCTCYFNLGDFDTVSKSIKKYYEINKKVGNKNWDLVILSYIGLVQLETKKYDKALINFKQYYDESEKTGDFEKIYFACKYTAQTYMRINKLAEAEKYIDKAITVSKQMNVPQYFLGILFEKALLLFEQKEYDKALKLISKIKRNSEKSDDKSFQLQLRKLENRVNVSIAMSKQRLNSTKINSIISDFLELLKSEKEESEIAEINYLLYKILNEIESKYENKKTDVEVLSQKYPQIKFKENYRNTALRIYQNLSKKSSKSKHLEAIRELKTK